MRQSRVPISDAVFERSVQMGRDEMGTFGPRPSRWSRPPGAAPSLMMSGTVPALYFSCSFRCRSCASLSVLGPLSPMRTVVVLTAVLR